MTKKDIFIQMSEKDVQEIARSMAEDYAHGSKQHRSHMADIKKVFRYGLTLQYPQLVPLFDKAYREQLDAEDRWLDYKLTK